MERILHAAIQLTKSAAQILPSLPPDSGSIHRKEGRDIASDADYAIESYMSQQLRESFPDYGIRGEEYTGSNSNSTRKREWIIDPIDGSINYAAGFGMFSISLALVEDGQPILGVIFDPSSGDLYSAIIGAGAFKNGVRLQVSSCSKLDDAILTFMLTSHYDSLQTENILGHVQRLISRTRGLRLIVSQALELALIARGVFEGTVCIKSSGYSSAAGVLLVREAGGTATSLNGEEYRVGLPSLLVSNGLLHPALLATVSESRRNR